MDLFGYETRTKRNEARSKRNETRTKRNEARTKRNEARTKRNETRSKRNETRTKRNEVLASGDDMLRNGDDALTEGDDALTALHVLNRRGWECEARSMECWSSGEEEEEGRGMAGVVERCRYDKAGGSAELGGPALRFQDSERRGVRRISPKFSGLWICGGSSGIEQLMYDRNRR
jgi:hypothetical protein